MMQSLQTTLGRELPGVFGALAVLIIGWIVAAVARAAVRRGLAYLRLNQRLASATGQSIDLEGAASVAVFWVVLLVALIGVFNTLDLGSCPHRCTPSPPRSSSSCPGSLPRRSSPCWPG